jgi:esterase/lipase superfamily enzyme
MGQKCTQGDKLTGTWCSQRTVLDYSSDKGEQVEWVSSGYILKFLLTELADDKKRKMEDEVFRM